MSRLDDLYPDIEGMSIDQLTERLREIRADRVIRKVRKTTKKPQRRASGDKLKEILKAMTPEQRKELLGGIE